MPDFVESGLHHIALPRVTHCLRICISMRFASINRMTSFIAGPRPAQSMQSASDDGGGFDSEVDCGFTASEDGGGFTPSEDGGGLTASDQPKASTRRSRSRSPRRTGLLDTVASGIAWLVSPVPRKSMAHWANPIVDVMAHVREDRHKNYLLLRPLSHDALLCGAIVEHYGLEAHPIY
jgi:hypothetical protein